MARSIDIRGHRGARALYPENTLGGFAAAAALGVSGFELDVGMTADGVVVVSHDPALNPDITRDASGAWLSGKGPAIHCLTFAALSRYDVGRIRPGSAMAMLFPDQAPLDGARIPALAEVLAALPSCRFLIEVKTYPNHPDWTAEPALLADATVAVIDNAGAGERAVVESFDWRVQRHIRAEHPEIGLAWLTRDEGASDAALWRSGAGVDISVPASVAAEGGTIWSPDHGTLTQRSIDEAHAQGLLVLPWTVNEPEDMRRLLAWGVDGLVSDRPDLALACARDPG